MYLYIRTILVCGGVSVFLVIIHCFFYLLYRIRIVLVRIIKKRTEVVKDGFEIGNNVKLLEYTTVNGDIDC